MGIKDYFTKKVVDHKTKDLPPQQQEMVRQLFNSNPELMEKISAEIKHKTKKEGKSEMTASMEVMRKYQGEIQKAAAGKQ